MIPASDRAGEMAVFISTGRSGLAEYACLPEFTRGRLYPESGSPTRTVFQRDRDRIIHSSAFRRLKHKTQVFVFHEGDHYRTRLTHSIEVSQIARALARAFSVDEDLAEALALCHDFGHTPFGHAGEEALDELMAGHGGFDHNAQSLRIVTKLEKRYAAFDGLNLSWETLEGLVKHNGPLIGPAKEGSEPVHEDLLAFNRDFDLELDRFAGLEAQCAAIADDIAYNAHDLDDGLRAGLFDLEEIAELPLAGDHLKEVVDTYPDLERQRVIHEIVRRQITAMVEDAITYGATEISESNPSSADDIRNAGRAIVKFSENMRENVDAVRAFLFERMYRAPKVNRLRDGAARIMRDLFTCYLEKPDHLPVDWRDDWLKADGVDDHAEKVRLVRDFLAGMTDRYAVLEHQRLFDETPELR